ncbi:nose resistant to fluoxetine protein 6-like isoform X2 [Haemaphysalis longicornis]
MRSRKRFSPCSAGEVWLPVIVILLAFLANASVGITFVEEAKDEAFAAAAAAPPVVAAASPALGITDKIKRWIGDKMDESSPALIRKLFEADVSMQCSLGLLRLVRGLRNLEPWALRLFDASGKYPTGALQASKSDLGAFDECVETVVRDSHGHVTARGQYCNLFYFSGNNSDVEAYIVPAMAMAHSRIAKFKNHVFGSQIPMFRLGVCTLNDCTEQDLQALISAVVPREVDFRVTNCVTGELSALNGTQIIIISVLGIIAFITVLSTAADLHLSTRLKSTSHGNEKCAGVLAQALTSFSLVSNIRALLSVAKDKESDSYRFRFLHGLRVLSIASVVIGHCYGCPSDTWSRVVNNVIMSDRWTTMIVAAGFIGVDTFFFLRTMIPAFFIVMCMCLLPAFTSGPDAKAYFDKFHREVARHWLPLLLQADNFNYEDDGSGKLPLLAHFWYLSVDFQFFVVSLFILIVFERKPRCTIIIFAALSLVGCAVATWQVAGNDTPPFIVVVDESVSNFFHTMYHYYFYPPYHAVCYFSGPIVFLLLERFNKARISAKTQAAGWCVAVTCGLCCIFMKLSWYRAREPTTEFWKLSATFFDRILWSVFIAWVTLACASGRGGFVHTLLSWGLFPPLARLAFGVYLVHLPFIQLTQHVSRERMLLEHFAVVSFCFAMLAWSYSLSFFLFIFCEAPTSKLDRLLFEGRRNLRSKKTDAPSTAKGVPIKPQQVLTGFTENNSDCNAPSRTNSCQSIRPQQILNGFAENNHRWPSDERRTELSNVGVKLDVEAMSCHL